MEEKLSFILRSRFRISVVKALFKEDLDSSRIMKLTGLRKEHTFRLMRELQNYEIIRLTKRGKGSPNIYSLTDKGKKIVALLESLKNG